MVCYFPCQCCSLKCFFSRSDKRKYHKKRMIVARTYWWRPSPSHLLFFSSDIKPENLLISSDDVLKLCDFGERTYPTLTLWGLEERRQNSQSCDIKGIFSTEAIFGWSQCFRGAAARLHLLSKDACSPFCWFSGCCCCCCWEVFPHFN